MRDNATGKPIEILLVEDNPGDVRLTLETLQDVRALGRVSVVRDGVQALAFLRRQGQYAQAPRPDLIFLDLNLPKKDGHQVLAELKSDENLKRIPVIVLTTSSAAEDIGKAYDLYANCYIVKPVDLDQFIAVIDAIESFWCTVASLPPGV